MISDEDVRVLESEGMEQIWVTELEDGEVGEDEAVKAVASEMGCGSFEIRAAAGGRANLIATEDLLRAGGRRTAAADQLHFKRGDRDRAEFQPMP